jgi:hypothetical protein
MVGGLPIPRNGRSRHRDARRRLHAPSSVGDPRDYSGQLSWLPAVLIVVRALAFIALLAFSSRRVRLIATAAAVGALLLAPSVWAVDTLGHAASGTFPAGGPASAASDGFGAGARSAGVERVPALAAASPAAPLLAPPHLQERRRSLRAKARQQAPPSSTAAGSATAAGSTTAAGLSASGAATGATASSTLYDCQGRAQALLNAGVGS